MSVLNPQLLTEQNHSRKIGIRQMTTDGSKSRINHELNNQDRVRYVLRAPVVIRHSSFSFTCHRVDTIDSFCMHRRVKWLPVLLLLVLHCSCTTLSNRRDLYSPEPSPTSYEYARQRLGKTTITTTSTTTSTRSGTETEESAEPLPKPAFRY